MRKWAVPLTLLGVGGLGAFMFTERGRKTLRWIFHRLEEAPEHIAEWNDTAQGELEKIQKTINQLAESLRVNLAR